MIFVSFFVSLFPIEQNFHLHNIEMLVKERSFDGSLTLRLILSTCLFWFSSSDPMSSAIFLKLPIIVFTWPILSSISSSRASFVILRNAKILYWMIEDTFTRCLTFRCSQLAVRVRYDRPWLFVAGCWQLFRRRCPSKYHRLLWTMRSWKDVFEGSWVATWLALKSWDYLLQGKTQIPQHFSMPLKFFSASRMSALIWSIPSSIRSSCSVRWHQFIS